MRVRRPSLLLALSLWLPGCGNALYAVHAAGASEALARAEQLGAATKAPYEYYFALEHLRQARREAAEAEYGAADRLVSTAREHAERALRASVRIEAIAPRPGSVQ